MRIEAGWGEIECEPTGVPQRSQSANKSGNEKREKKEMDGSIEHLAAHVQERITASYIRFILFHMILYTRDLFIQL